MPTTTVLRDLPHARLCHLLLIDGIEHAFTDNPILGVADFTGHGHLIWNYLDTAGTDVEEALVLRSGQLDESTATFRLRDLDGILPDLFKAEDTTEEPLLVSVYPGDSLAARTELHSKHVGTEAIGSTGARHRFPAIGSYQIGDMHPGVDQELPHHRPAPVSDDPIVWKGRRVALYRCYIDLNGTRRPYPEAERIWWGEMLDQGSVDGRDWTISCNGPASWLQGELGLLTQRDPEAAIGLITLETTAGSDTSGMHISLDRDANENANVEVYGTRDFLASITGATPFDIIQEIDAELQTASAVVGTDGAFDASENRYVTLDDSGRFTIHADDNGSITYSRAKITLHRSIWPILGYDVEQQSLLPNTDHRKVLFGEFGGDAPGPDYLTAHITAIDEFDFTNGENGGIPKIYLPFYPGGTTTLLAGLNNGDGQIIDLGNGFDDSIVYARGQLDRPLPSVPGDSSKAYSIPGVGDVTNQGVWLFYGRRREGSNEFDEFQVARAAWRSGQLGQRGQVLGSKLVVTAWLNPRLFGFRRDAMTTDWVSRADAIDEFRIQAVPIHALTYATGALEQAHVVLERLMRSTGTSTGWSGFASDPTAVLDPGDNNSAGNPRRDAEVADLGLAIPDDMVDNVISFGLVALGLPGSELGKVRPAFTSGMSAADLVEGLTRPFGWCISLRGGRYGIFDPFATPSPDLVDFVLDGATKLGSLSGDRTTTISQDLRAFAPVDKFELEYDWTPSLESFRRTYTAPSMDVGRRYRSGGIDEKHSAHGMRQLSGWPTRARELGEWWSRRHFFVRDWPYMGRRPAHVGEIVRITDPRGTDPAGSYELTEMIGLVVGVSTALRPGPDEPWCRLDLLVYANSSDPPRLHAMVGQGFGYDTATDRLYVRPNWLEYDFAGGWPGDETFFAEPALLGVTALGGDLEIAVGQWDGDAWQLLAVNPGVTAVGSDGNGAYLQLDAALTGYLHRRDSVVVAAPRGVLAAAWGLGHYGVVSSKAGTFTGPTSGFKWEDL